MSISKCLDLSFVFETNKLFQEMIGAGGGSEKRSLYAKLMHRKSNDLMMQGGNTVKNVCDLWILASSLSVINGEGYRSIRESKDIDFGVMSVVESADRLATNVLVDDYVNDQKDMETFVVSDNHFIDNLVRSIVTFYARHQKDRDLVKDIKSVLENNNNKMCLLSELESTKGFYKSLDIGAEVYEVSDNIVYLECIYDRGITLRGELLPSLNYNEINFYE